jgi:hypothetical protein
LLSGYSVPCPLVGWIPMVALLALEILKKLAPSAAVDKQGAKVA